MKERPILFSGPMVRAILDGRKSQTRRICKAAPDDEAGEYRDADGWPLTFDEGTASDIRAGCPYGQSGDLLWVRETFRPCASGEVKDRHGHVRYGYAYKADASVLWRDYTTEIHDFTDKPRDTGPLQFQPKPWKPSIHMPRRASRLTLRITNIRVERLQDISEADAEAEGVKAVPFPGPWWQGYRDYGDGELIHQEAVGEQPPDWMIEPKRMSSTEHLDRSAVQMYRSLWDSINGKGSWDANPWVWVIEFERIEQRRAAA